MAVAHVQTSAEAYGLEVSSFAPSLTGVTAGNHVACAVSYVPSASTNTACPTPSGWSVAEAPTSTFGTAYAPRAAIFYKQNAGAGTQTATFSLPAGSYIGAQIIEHSGASTTASLDVHANTIGTHASTGSVTTGASTVADSFVIATGCVEAESFSTPPTTGYTAIGYDDGNNITYSPGRKILSATGTQSATWTWSNAGGSYTGNHALVIAVFKADAGGGTSDTTATAAAGAATVSGAGASTAAAAGTSAAGVATVSAAGRSTAATGASAAAGVASVSAVGAAVQTTTATAATGAATVSATADSVAAASASAAAGVAAVSGAGASAAVTSGAVAAGTASTGATGSSTAASSATPAAGSATVSGVGSSQAAGQTTAIPASGASTVSAQGASVAACDAVPAAGTASVSATTPSSAPTGSMGFEMGGKPAPRRVRYASIKPMLAAALESRLPEPETEDLAEPRAANAVTAGIVALQSEQLTPQLVERLAKQWRPAVTLAPNTTRQDAQLLYLRAVLAQKQAQEAQEAAIRRAKARADDEQAIAMALRLLF